MSPLTHAIHSKCFTLPIFIKWLDRYGPLPTTQRFIREPDVDADVLKNFRAIQVPLRWLQPQNADFLIPLLRNQTISFPRERDDDRIANFNDALFFAANPDVPFQWILSIREDHCFKCRTYYKGEVEKPLETALDQILLCYALKRPNITKEELDILSPPDPDVLLPPSLGHLAFNSKMEGAIRWAIERGLAPSTEQLTEFTNN